MFCDIGWLQIFDGLVVFEVFFGTKCITFWLFHNCRVLRDMVQRGAFCNETYAKFLASDGRRSEAAVQANTEAKAAWEVGGVHNVSIALHREFPSSIMVSMPR